MKRIKSFIDRFNQPENILVVSSYPEKGIKYSGKVCAVGGFAKNTVESLLAEFKRRGEARKIVVLTVTTNGKEEIYEERKVLVIRCLKRNRLLSYLSLVGYLWQFNKVKKFLVEFEFASFGGIRMSLGFLGVLGIARVLGKRITLVLHQVVFDLGQLSGHLGFGQKSFKTRFFESMLAVYYRLICLPAEKIIVLEKEFKKRLSCLVAPQKIIVIPHGVDNSLKSVGKAEARKKLGIGKSEKIILYFGYLTWYKGIDWLLKTYLQLTTNNLQLIVAGGASFTQKDKPHYQRYLDNIYWLAKKNKIAITGFLPEDKIKLYFSAADLVVLPYRSFMSSSGPLSMALAWGKPFILSQPLAQILATKDFSQGLKEAGLCPKDLVFDLNQKSLAEKLRVLRNVRNLRKLAKLAKIMAKKRDFTNLSSSFVELLKAEEAVGDKNIIPALKVTGMIESR